MVRCKSKFRTEERHPRKALWIVRPTERSSESTDAASCGNIDDFKSPFSLLDADIVEMFTTLDVCSTCPPAGSQGSHVSIRMPNYRVSCGPETIRRMHALIFTKHRGDHARSTDDRSDMFWTVGRRSPTGVWGTRYTYLW